MSNDNIAEKIKEAVVAAQRKFAEKPCDFLSSEKEAQFLLYSELQQQVKGSVVIQRTDAVPPLKDQQETRVKLEWAVGNAVHDIAVLEADSIDPEGYDSVEAFIEVKYGWADCKGILAGKTRGDFEKLSARKSKGYLVIFVGNEWEKMHDIGADQCFYRDTLKQFKEKEYPFSHGHVFVVFRDRILTGEGDTL